MLRLSILSTLESRHMQRHVSSPGVLAFIGTSSPESGVRGLRQEGQRANAQMSYRLATSSVTDCLLGSKAPLR